MEELLKDLDLSLGLSSEEASKRLKTYGYNELPEPPRPTLLAQFLDQFKSMLVLILIVAAIISAFFGELIDTLVIIGITILNATLGVVQQRRAESALEAVKKLSNPTSKVLRDGKVQTIPSREVVPGDVLILEAGDKVSCDGVLVEVYSFMVDESTLTGESVSVSKTSITGGESPSEENMVFMGTAVTKGRAKALVTSTGVKTKLGQIASKIKEVKKDKTPLEIQLDVLGKILGLTFVVVCAVILIMGIIRGIPFQEMFLTSISLAVAAIPEGLPAVVTIVLALGVAEMARRKAVVRNLPAVETLGSVTVICTDKTGTLTQNRMTLVEIYTDALHLSGEALDTTNVPYEIQRAMILCNDATKDSGDPTEIALISWLPDRMINDLRSAYPRIYEVPFTSERKRMSTVHKFNDEYLIVSKGAVEVILDICNYELVKENRIVPITDTRRSAIIAVAEGLASQGLRILAIAEGKSKKVPQTDEEVESGLTFLGLLCLKDPLRPEVKEAVENCRRAGIRPVMITGDHQVTAYSIAKELDFPEGKVLTSNDLAKSSDEELAEHIEEVSVFARINPLDKLRIVEAFQKKQEVVAMTGDGVNDAPALKKSDIGVAMGQTGTEVAKEASDMVLLDDNFATLVSAVFQGRTIYENIRKFVVYLLSCNIGEVLIMFTAIVLGYPPPLLPLQLLWLNLVTDSFPALALGMEPGEEEIMFRPPRGKKEPLLTGYHMGIIVTQSIAIAFATLLSFFLVYRGNNLNEARTVAYMTLVISELIRVFSARSFETPVYRINLFTNKFLFYSILGSLGALFVSVYFTPLAKLFNNVIPTVMNLDTIILCAFIPFVISEIAKFIRRP
ncbi:MAG: calcium-translocating P-type ATPase, PMCA-type [bacterium]|nr:calcium-translocating P-type ATPase, PMCA-type [bacterium]